MLQPRWGESFKRYPQRYFTLPEPPVTAYVLIQYSQALGFLALGGENKVRLLPNSWPLDALPAPTSSLLSTAPNKGLVAAAGVDALVIASTHAIRAAFRGQPSDSSSIVPFEPQLKIPMPMRVSQVSFSADESYLVISAEQGGGLAVYDVNSITQGLTQSAFELSTNGVALRALLPNPTPAKAELLAMVTVNGDLLMANMNSRQFAAGPTGQALKQGVSCISWSNKGKQLVAGLGNGTAYQMTPEGEGKAEIPSPPGLTGGYHGNCFSLAVVGVSFTDNYSVINILARERLVPYGPHSYNIRF